MQNVLVTNNLGKKYPGSDCWALRDLNLTCARGEITALTGINGAGKTTTLRLIASTLKPSTGEVHINGRPAEHRSGESRRQIGILFGGISGLYKRLTARENILYFARLNGLSIMEAEQNLKKLSTWLKLDGFLDTRADRFSTGMRQRTIIARAIIHDPPLLLLDEPATGLDPRAAENIYTFISECREEGKTVIFSSHNLGASEKLSDKIVLLDKGGVAAAGRSAEIAAIAGLPATASLEESFFSLIKEEESP